ncbi:thermosome subunit [Halorubrum sp. JWXQ-INN 858]|uniref:thermosome subunit alpha n=1 Tax=Halorubrum sp. JWXQ-INN 858 TaxID=2690782 RepID=UPI0013569CD7|nr:thermosome subunit alpha [Halorubrum sp. JWXQ-INN 858]MWV63345.1 thermosome subunit [Halorubrum sp. JWXQ-INN 858]
MRQPMYVLSEDSTRTRGRAAQDSNVAAGKAVAEAVRTTLGPRGMDKMLVDSTGDVVITNDGATILAEMDIDHPAAQMIVEVAESQEEVVGDGTTTAAVLVGELLARAEDLVDDDIHPTVIVEGYAEAARLAHDAIDEQVLDDDLDDDLLVSVAESSMTGKGTGDVAARDLAALVVEAVRSVATDDGARVNRDHVHIHPRAGAASSATEVVDGVVIDEEPAHDNMPRSVTDGTVAILDAKLEVRQSDVDAEYSITSVEGLSAAIDAEDAELRGYAETLSEAGVDVLFCRKKIDDRVAGFLADAGILAFESVGSDDASDVARVTGAKRLGTLDGIEASDLGRVESIEIETYGEDELAFVRGGEDSRAATLLVRGSTEHVVDELERAMNDAVDVVVAALDDGGVVPGAGATEIAIASQVRGAAAGVEGRKQLAIEAFADAVDALPRTLAENTGADPIDTLVDLRARHDKEGRAGVIAEGRAARVGDPLAAGIVDPAAVKREAVDSATEAATMILRIDDVIAAE